MTNRKNNVLPFPKPPEEPGISTINCQIGSERFALHIQVEDLPPAPLPPAPLPLLTPKQSAKKAASKIVK
jgi:hypothetical protein